MTQDLFFAFAAFALIASITPGPNNLMLMASGTNFGLVRSIPHALGVSIGFTAMVLVIGVGVAQVFAAFPVAHDVLKVLCAAYLIYLAWKIATAPPPKPGAPAGKPLTFMQAALFQWVNPKGWSMALTAVSAYAVGDSLWSYALIAVLFGIINLPSIGVWTVLGVQMRHFLDNPRALRAFNIGAALLLVASLYPALIGH